MIDENRWRRLLVHLHARNTEDDPDLTRAERATVLDFAAVHARLTEENP